jgi:hypothetical protein
VAADLQLQHKPLTVELRSVLQSSQPTCLEWKQINYTVGAIWWMEIFYAQTPLYTSGPVLY